MLEEIEQDLSEQRKLATAELYFGLPDMDFREKFKIAYKALQSLDNEYVKERLKYINPEEVSKAGLRNLENTLAAYRFFPEDFC